MTIEEFRDFANCLKNNYTIDFDKLPEFCDMALSLTQWIPVAERLPKEGRNVLFCDIDDDIMLGYHLNRAPATHFVERGAWEDVKNVRAWMELPEPYKGGDS